ncbi:hypothetical protein P3J6_90264 [Pseudoalteromonas sp. 3J6]|nr:hypothetical protein P3J6_90264 [Pseudoalteromonas sp. 3J6]
MKAANVAINNAATKGINTRSKVGRVVKSSGVSRNKLWKNKMVKRNSIIKNAAINPALTPNKHNCTDVFGFANRRLSRSSHMLYFPVAFLGVKFIKIV